MGAPTAGYQLKPRTKHGLIVAMCELLCGSSALSLEGDLSRIADAVAQIPGVAYEPSSILGRQTIEPLQDFIILPLNFDTFSAIRTTILNQVGFGSRVLHAQIAKDGALQFGAYDLDGWGPGMEALCFASTEIPEAALKQFVSRRLLWDYERWSTAKPGNRSVTPAVDTPSHPSYTVPRR